MSDEKKVKIRKAVGVAKRDNQWGAVIISYNEETGEVTDQQFKPSNRNQHAAAIIDAQIYAEDAILGNGLED